MLRAFVGTASPTRTTGILASALSRDADGVPCAMRWLLFFLVSILPATRIHRQELLRGIIVRVYNVAGYLLLLAYAAACLYFALTDLGQWAGLGGGALYLLTCWFVAGLYLSSVIHMGIAHRSLDYKE